MSALHHEVLEAVAAGRGTHCSTSFVFGWICAGGTRPRFQQVAYALAHLRRRGLLNSEPDTRPNESGTRRGHLWSITPTS